MKDEIMKININSIPQYRMLLTQADLSVRSSADRIHALRDDKPHIRPFNDNGDL